MMGAMQKLTAARVLRDCVLVGSVASNLYFHRVKGYTGENGIQWNYNITNDMVLTKRNVIHVFFICKS